MELNIKLLSSMSLTLVRWFLIIFSMRRSILMILALACRSPLLTYLVSTFARDFIYLETLWVWWIFIIFVLSYLYFAICRQGHHLTQYLILCPGQLVLPEALIYIVCPTNVKCKLCCAWNCAEFRGLCCAYGRLVT